MVDAGCRVGGKLAPVPPYVCDRLVCSTLHGPQADRWKRLSTSLGKAAAQSPARDGDRKGIRVSLRTITRTMARVRDVHLAGLMMWRFCAPFFLCVVFRVGGGVPVPDASRHLQSPAAHSLPPLHLLFRDIFHNIVTFVGILMAVDDEGGGVGERTEGGGGGGGGGAAGGVAGRTNVCRRRV